jgi:hypothetical protein
MYRFDQMIILDNRHRRFRRRLLEEIIDYYAQQQIQRIMVYALSDAVRKDKEQQHEHEQRVEQVPQHPQIAAFGLQLEIRLGDGNAQSQKRSQIHAVSRQFTVLLNYV